MTDIDDQTLVQDFKSSRRAECFAPLFLRYARRIFALAYRFHRDHGRADDCVQETFLRAFVEIDRYDETVQNTSFWAWLRTIARNICIDELRRTHRRTIDAPLNSGSAGPTQEQVVMIRELRDQLKALPAEYGMSYLLSTDGYSYKEIVDLTGFSYDQVKTFIQTAKRHLGRRFR
jgi:RNA polymerase sigma-70 factor (ECF subfamily)